MPLISVIMPAYNVEKYIEKTLKNVLGQTFADFEIVLINDGSTDRTQEICERIAAGDNRIRLINKKNGGVSDARNCGLDHMRGKYMTFVDSDDLMANDYLEYLYNLINMENDIQISTAVGKEILEGQALQGREETKREVMSAEKAACKMLLRNEITHANWGKLYDVRLWEDVRFPLGKLYEDYDITYRVFAKADTVACGNAQKYFYVQRAGSIMHKAVSRETVAVLDISDGVTKFMLDVWPNSRIEIIDMQVHTYLKCLQSILNHNKDSFLAEQKRIIDKVKKEAKSLLVSPITPRNDKIKIISLMLGKKIFISIYNAHDGNLKLKQ